VLIIHRCTTCNQPDHWRDTTGKTAGATVDGQAVSTREQRTCCDRRASWGPPETAPRWKTLTCEPITEVCEPGGKGNGGHQAATTCDCDACWALYRELVPDAHPARHLAVAPA
jgi:hypothetical protein